MDNSLKTFGNRRINMKISQQLRQCLWVIGTIYNAGSITFEDLNEKWKTSELSEGMDLSRTTFNRIRDSIQTVFGIIIECQMKGGYHYYIYNKDELTCQQQTPEFCQLCPCKNKNQNVFLCLSQNCIYVKIN